MSGSKPGGDRGAVGAGEAPIPAIEWVVAGLGAAIVGAALLFLAVQLLMGDRSPPDLRVFAKTTRSLHSGFLVEVRAVNEGGQTAAQVEIEGVLTGSDGSREIARLTFDYLPDGSERDGGLVFRSNPSRGTLRLSVLGYADP